MKLGAMVQLREDMDKEFKNLTDLGLYTCQLSVWNKSLITKEMAQKIIDAFIKE